MPIAAVVLEDARATRTSLARRLRRVCLTLARSIPIPRRDERATALAVLSATDKVLLRRFIAAGTPRIRVESPAIAFGLELADIVTIHRVPRAARGEAYELAVHAWAWEHLKRRPDLLG